MDSDYIINNFKQCPSNLVFESKLTSRFTEGLARESSSQYIVFAYILPGVSNINSGNLPIIFFIFIATLGALSTAIIAYTGDGGNYHLAISGFTFIAALTCYFIIPATNRATDEGDTKKFNLCGN